MEELGEKIDKLNYKRLFTMPKNENMIIQLKCQTKSKMDRRLKGNKMAVPYRSQEPRAVITTMFTCNLWRLNVKSTSYLLKRLRKIAIPAPSYKELIKMVK